MIIYQAVVHTIILIGPGQPGFINCNIQIKSFINLIVSIT